MIPTFIGLMTMALGLWLSWRGSPMLLLCAMLAMGLFESSAALVLPALSGSSIPPPRLMLLFLLIAVFRQVQLRTRLAREALAANAPLLIFALYGMISASTLPLIFAGQINVVPLRPAGLRHLTDAFPLSFSPQNITTAFYIAGTGLAAVCAYVTARLTADVTPLVKTGVAITLVHAVTGVMGVALAGTPWTLVVDFVRNGSYSQLNQATESFIRITGFMAEPSSYARFGVVWLIFSFELWLRRVSPLWTGAAALLMLAVLAMSTSSSAYVGIAGYAVILAARFVTLPNYLDLDRLLKIALWGLVATAGVLALVLFYSPVAEAFTQMLDEMTVQKADSSSGQQRYFWAMQGLNAFMVSGGLGIGAGSFRSSSLITAIIGSMGVIGTVTFIAACASLFLPRRPLEERIRGYVSQAASWASVAGLIPGMVMQGSPDPGMEFAALAGLSLALRLPALAPLHRAGARQWGEALRAPPSESPALQPQIKPLAVPRSVGWRRAAR